MCRLRAFAIRLLLDFDACFEAVRVWHNKRIRGGVSQPAARAQPSTQTLFEQIVKETDRDHIIVIAHSPYVALVVRDEWEVIDACTTNKLCTKADIFV